METKSPVPGSGSRLAVHCLYLRAADPGHDEEADRSMRWSQLHIPTLRDDPADADAASHRLLLRAGFIRQLMAGHYSLLPLGMRVRAKVVAVIREEMNAIGAQEFHARHEPAAALGAQRPCGRHGG